MCYEHGREESNRRRSIAITGEDPGRESPYTYSITMSHSFQRGVSLLTVANASLTRARRSVLAQSKMAKTSVNGINGTGMPHFIKMKHDFAALKVNQNRLMDAIHSGCKYGQAHSYGNDATETGMARLSLNDADKQVRDWFKSTVEAIGCSYSVDQMGNQFAIRPGKNKTDPVMMGSHLDTQPTGGRYDGILGVNAGLEVLKVLHEHKVETEGSVGVVNWTK